MTSPDYGKKYVWCQHHGPNNGKSVMQTGIYMLAPHNYAKWLSKNNKKPDAWNYQQKEMKAASNKRKVYFETNSNTNSNAKKRGKNGNIVLIKSFKSALVTKVQIYDPEVQDILDTAMANAKKDSNDNSNYESKE